MLSLCSYYRYTAETKRVDFVKEAHQRRGETLSFARAAFRSDLATRQFAPVDCGEEGNLNLVCHTVADDGASFLQARHGANTSDNNDINMEDTIFQNARKDDRHAKEITQVTRQDLGRVAPDGPALLRMLYRYEHKYIASYLDRKRASESESRPVSRA